MVLAALLAATTVAVPATSQAAVVRRLDLAVLNPMPAERLAATGVISLNLRPVALQADIGVSRAWVVIARGTSTATGRFRILYVAPRRLGALKLRVVGTPARGAAVATAYRLLSVTRPAASLTAALAGTTGTTVRMTVLARPPRVGRLIAVQRRRVGTTLWAKATAARREAGTTGSTAFSVALGAVTGVHEFRATFATPTGPIATAIRRVTIGAPPPVVVPTGPVRPVVTLLAAPGAGAPALDSLAGSDADFTTNDMRWNPCRAISYRVNVTPVPAGSQAAGADAISAALATISRDSGLQFTSLGATTFAHPATQTFETPAGRPADAAMTIAFVAAGTLVGEAGHAYVRSQSSSPTGVSQVTTADVVLFLDRLLDVTAPDTFDAAALRETLLHELGHAAGLGHASQESVMAGIKYGAAFSEYQRGDRAGLLAVGSPQGCYVG